jgi:hypothetical protein
MTYDITFGPFLKDMAFVNTIYIETRYPAEDPLIVSNKDVIECFKILDSIVLKIDTLIGFAN